MTSRHAFSLSLLALVAAPALAVGGCCPGTYHARAQTGGSVGVRGGATNPGRADPAARGTERADAARSAERAPEPGEAAGDEPAGDGPAAASAARPAGSSTTAASGDSVSSAGAGDRPANGGATTGPKEKPATATRPARGDSPHVTSVARPGSPVEAPDRSGPGNGARRPVEPPAEDRPGHVVESDRPSPGGRRDVTPPSETERPEAPQAPELGCRLRTARAPAGGLITIDGGGWGDKPSVQVGGELAAVVKLTSTRLQARLPRRMRSGGAVEVEVEGKRARCGRVEVAGGR